MTNWRTIAVTAACGGLLSGLLAIHPNKARADELSDLRANQELLQRRIDQLAQGMKVEGGVYPYGPPSAVAGQPSIAGSFPRSFLIPGTDTSIKVYGEAREILDYFITGGNPNASPQNSTVGDNGQLLSIPTSGAARSRSHGIFWETPQESKLGVETRTPTAWGEARTVVEFDFDSGNTFVPGGAGPTDVSDSIKPRLRFAYGTLGGFLAGQANSNFSDPDGNAETLDFGGNVGEAGVVRIPQVRYTVPLAPWGWLGAVSFSAETPETNGATAAGQLSTDAGAVTSPVAVTTSAATAASTGVTSISPALSAPLFNPFKDPAPDLTAAWYVPQPWGHWDMSAVLRPTAQIKDGLSVDRTFTGWGVHAGFDVKPGWFGWAKDDILIQGTGGIGIGRYLNCACTVELQTNYPDTATAGFNSKLQTHMVPAFGGEIGYQHWWLANLRSDINMGWMHQDLRSTMFNDVGGGVLSYGGFNKELMNAHVNLIWNPVSFVTVGVEYTWGHRVTVANAKGDMNVLISKFGVSF